MDNGDKLGTITPGDTVIILPGNYILTDSVFLGRAGTSSRPITYRSADSGMALLDGALLSDDAVVVLDGQHNVIEGLEIANSPWDGIQVRGGDSSVRW